MKIGNFIVDTTKYEYIEPIWPILENHPEGITLKKLVKQSGLEQKRMLNTIEKMSFEFKQKSKGLLSKDFLNDLIESVMTDKKNKDVLLNDFALSWITDKALLYNRVKELKWTDMVMQGEQFDKIKQIWMESKGT